MGKTELDEKCKKLLADLKALKNKKGAKYEFLESIADSLKKVIKVANFKQIQKGLKDSFQQDISVSTIKRFCVDKGFYKPKAIAKKQKTILILIDMQNGFLQQEHTKQLVPKIETLLQKKIFDSVIATKFVNTDNSPFTKIMQWNGMIEPNEQEIIESLKQYIDITIIKNTYDCVNKAFIEQLYKVNDDRKPNKIYLAGVDTDACVLAIAMKLFDNKIRPIVLTQYCHSNGGLEYHNAGLLCLKRNIGTKQIIDIEISDKAKLSAMTLN